MGKVRINEYIMTNPKIIKDKIILCISDIHGNVSALRDILNVIKNMNIDYIFMPGDIIDYLTQDNQDKLISLLSEFKKCFRIFMCIGNHDMYDPKLKYKDLDELEDFNFYKEINEEVTLFKDKFGHMSIDDELDVYALNFDKEYYESRENSKVFDLFIDKIKFPIISEDKFNILITHTPNNLIKNREIIDNNFINDMNLILSGHNHGGLVPTFFQDIFKNNMGLFGPYHLFTYPAYGIVEKDNTSILISNGVEKISETSPHKIVHKPLKLFYMPEIDLIKLSHSDKHNLKLKRRLVLK